MNRRCLLSGIAALLLLSHAGSAAAADTNGFGEKGQLILSADRLVPVFGYTGQSITTTDNNVTRKNSDRGTSIGFLFGEEPGIGPGIVHVHTTPRVAFDIAVINHLTVGGAIAVGIGLGGTHETETKPANGVTTTQSYDAATTTVLGFAPRVGYVLPLTDVLAFWPRGGFAYYSVRAKSDINDNNGTGSDTLSASLLSLDLDPQLAIVPTAHFFFHVGPIVNIPLTGSLKREEVRGPRSTTISSDLSVFHVGLTAGIGGYFGLF